MHPLGCKEPCSAAVPPHYLQKNRMEGGRLVVLWQIKEAGAADPAEEPVAPAGNSIHPSCCRAMGTGTAGPMPASLVEVPRISCLPSQLWFVLK